MRSKLLGCAVLFTAMLITGTGGSLKGKAGAELVPVGNPCDGHEEPLACDGPPICANQKTNVFANGPLSTQDGTKISNRIRAKIGNNYELKTCPSGCTGTGINTTKNCDEVSELPLP
jgi:hypothetical protein